MPGFISPLKIDAHQHFWSYDPARHAWINNEMSVIKRDFLPQDLQPVLHENDLDGCVLIQVDQTDVETKFLLDLAEKNDYIKGVVGWIDLLSDNIEEQLESYKGAKKLKGFRHILQEEKNRSFMLKPEFKRGISALQKYKYTYDILVYPDQLQYLNELIEQFPEQKFVIDHLAKPYIKTKKTELWKEDIQEMGKYENVYCKISGMVTEANWYNWQEKDFMPYIDIVVKAFGKERVMFGSDWPMCLVAASYSEVINIVRDYFSLFTREDQDNFFGLNAIKFYNL